MSCEWGINGPRSIWMICNNINPTWWMMIIPCYRSLRSSSLVWSWIQIDKISYSSSSTTTIHVHKTLFHCSLFSCFCLLSGGAWVRPAAIKVQRRAGLPLESPPSTSSIRNNISTDRTTMIDDSCAKLIIPATIKININFWPGEYVYDDRDQFQSSPPSFLGTYRYTSTYWSTRVSSTDWLNVSDTSNNTSIGQRDILRSIRNLVVASL